MGSGGQSSSTKATVPKELKGYYEDVGTTGQDLLRTLPVSDFAMRNPTRIAPLSGTQRKSVDFMNMNLDDAMSTPLENSSIVQAGNRYFDTAIAPGIENRAALSGLGRSTALSSALSGAEAAAMLPLMQGEQARRDAMISGGLQAGDVERGVEQAGYNAEAADAQRRQGLAEQALFGPLNQLPSTFGRSSTASGGGLFKSVALPWIGAVAQGLFLLASGIA